MNSMNTTPIDMDQLRSGKVSLSIGQVVYIVSATTIKVVPAVVCERILTETLEGKSVSWKVIVGSKSDQKIVALEKVSGDKFITLEAAKNELRDRFEQVMSEEIDSCLTKAEQWFGFKRNALLAASGPVDLLSAKMQQEQPDEPVVEQQQSVDIFSDDEAATTPVSFAKVTKKQPDVPKKPVGRPRKQPTTESELKDKLRASMSVTDEELAQEEEQEQTSQSPTQKRVTMPDGSVVLVNG